ncbi:MAG: hypothetical protein HYU57_10025 [Micavibrio aeruginosavorus]|nr:hypothetical protein [Micavibrio aeruginosavorus]
MPASYFHNYIRNRDGAIMPMAALMIPVMLGMIGLGVDASGWMMNQRNLQNAADAAAIAAAWEIAYNYEDNYEEAGLREAENNGYDSSLEGSSLTLERETDEDGYERITANVQMRAKMWFAPIVFDSDVTLATTAATAIVDPNGDFCILSLDETAAAAISAVGTANIDANGCGLAVNSNSNTALDFTGSVVVDVGDVSIVGEDDVGPNVTFNYTSKNVYANPIPDPYDDLGIPDCSGCTTYNNEKVTTTQTIQPGVYEGGLTISGNNTVTFEPGVYIIKDGDFKVTGGGALIGDGVTFILTGSSGASVGNLNISGGREVNFSAPDAGYTFGGENLGGILIYQDRAATGSGSNSFLGTAAINLDGVIYTPSRHLDFGGTNDTSSEVCTKLIAETIKFHGTPGIGNDCSGNPDVREFGVPNIRLVL